MESKRLFISFLLFKNRVNKHGLSPLYIRLTVDSKRENVSTGIFIEAKQWDDKKAKIKGGSPEVLNQNNLLNTIKSKALSIYTELLMADKPISSAIIKSKLTGQDENKITLLETIIAHNNSVRKGVGINSSKATLAKYETLRIKIEAYVKRQYNRKDFLLKELNHSFLVNFEMFLKSQEGIGHNTTIKYIQFFKKIINYAIANEWLQYSPFKAYKCSFEQVNRGYLSNDEIKLLEDKVFPTNRLNQVRDIFIFCCYTGLSYADVKKLTTKEIANGIDGELWIQTFRAKTKVRVPIPLLPQALAILTRYHEWRVESGKNYVLPVITNQKMNAYLKEIADLCNIDKKLTFHLSRHTFATTVTLSNGVPIETVSKLLGHTNIRTTQIYSKVVDLKISEDMNLLKERLKGKK
ncbi:MAG: site-specific integrase [Flavipsychrobacter sp.]|nr:site-specific integrase [Flavipsychrobacter sp.]